MSRPSYPSPKSAAQTAGGGGPFFSQNPNASASLPQDTHKVQDDSQAQRKVPLPRMVGRDPSPHDPHIYPASTEASPGETRYTNSSTSHTNGYQGEYPSQDPNASRDTQSKETVDEFNPFNWRPINGHTGDYPSHPHHSQQYPRVEAHAQGQTPHERLAQGVLDMSDTPQTRGYDEDNSQDGPRKRNKVSRACDECRRKKIRCDATNESAEQSCSNCKRTGAACRFSRQPMKRGPSKGYIKELADRLNTLEYHISPQGVQHLNQALQYLNSEGSPPLEGEESSPSMATGSRKRKQPTSESDLVPPYAASSNTRLSAAPQSEQRTSQPPDRVSPGQSIQSSELASLLELARQQGHQSNFYRYSSDGRQTGGPSTLHESDAKEIEVASSVEWDDNVVNE